MEDNVRVSLDYLAKINYAVYENSLSVVRHLHIENHSDIERLEVVLNISFQPEFIKPYSVTIPNLPAGKSVDLGQIPLELITEFILSLTETVRGEMILELTAQDLNQKSTHPLEVLPFDQWGGYQDSPEILAAFSTPHHPAVTNRLVRAGEILKNLTGRGAFSGYLAKDPNQVLRQVSAIYSAIAELQLNSVPALPGTSETGQRIRLVDELIDKGFATALDLTMLFCAMAEAVGLHPLVILLEGHTLPGVWLNGDLFPETINYDSTAITKRMAKGMNQIALFEATLLTKREHCDFNQALESAAQRMETTDQFVLSLDIFRARNLGIRPLPVRVQDQGRYVLAPRLSFDEQGVLPKELLIPGSETLPEQEKLPKQKVWERKLLDLSLRNALINYRPGKSGIPLAVHDVLAFAKDFMGEAEFSILPRPQDWDPAGGPGETADSRETADPRESLAKDDTSLFKDSSLFRESSSFRELAKEEYNSGRIRTLFNETELEDRGQKLVKGAKSALEEMGASSLYLGLGILKWFSREDPKTPRYAPLVLVPAEAKTRGHLAGLTLTDRDEDGRFNVTLLEMLKTEFGIVIEGLDPLPSTTEGIDLIKIFSKVRSGILREKNWDVLEEAHLGLFSFAKFIMWNDLTKNLGEFKKNKIVDSLMNGQLTFPVQPIQPAEQFIDDMSANRDVIYPVSSDASQSLAVLSSTLGQSFVLHGPPGTGKSQTITNIIANALLNDKRVLFVAQKMAALEVVERRLNDIGIGSFCLELHSNKARKKVVLDQLEASMKIQRIPKNLDFSAQKEEIRSQKAQLNSLVKKMYEVDESGYSIFDLICENTKLADFTKFIELSPEFDSTDLKTKEAALHHLAKMGSHATGPYGHPLRGVGAVSFRPLLKEDIQAAGQIDGEELSQALTDLISGEAGLVPTTLAEVLELVNALETIALLTEKIPQLPQGADLWTLVGDLKVATAELEELDLEKAKFLKTFNAEFLKADPVRMERDFKAFEQQSVFGRLLRKNPVEKELAMLARTGIIDKTQILAILASLTSFQQHRLENQTKFSRQAMVLPEFRENELTLGLLRERIALIEAAAAKATAQERLDQLLRLVQEPNYGAKITRLKNALLGQEAKIRQWLELTGFDETELAAFAGDYFKQLGQKIAEVAGALDLLRDWLMYQEAQKTAIDLGLADFTRYYYNGHVSDVELLPAFKKSVLRRELRRRLEGESNLLKVTGHSLDETVADLKQKLTAMERLERKELYFHLASKVPNMVLERETSKEIAILQRALRSGSRSLSVRNLFAETDQLLRRIAPCMLMSPMSVAQYLKPEADMFDLVVFDEASQIQTSEAIGALGRAKEAIIVGDPKQLPPTYFFMTQNNGDEDPEFNDLDNILEDCLALSLSESYLLWHYRSRHESLISFSNRNFYDGSLYTYPSPDDMVSRVTLRQTGGVYERGGERVNRTEAQAVVDEVVRRLQDVTFAGQSMGIVTFSVVQQNLIEKLLKEKTQDVEELERALQNLPEPLFVKNLENVQGDERDVIMFSIGYGPDEAGKLTMNFGPINQEGGWRRLNVAVSRARLEMVVFTNINPNQFIVSQAQPRGVRDLKAFLEFAAKGSKMLTLAEVRHDAQIENLARLIAEKLRERGHQVETAIGTSRFKVDLGVVDPRDPDRFLLGIMCGGESFRTAQAAYDREILQPQVLAGLGWTIHRVFALDWLDNEVGVIDEICRKLTQILSQTTDIDTQTQLESDPALEVTESGNPETPADSSKVKPYLRSMAKGRPLTMDEFLKVTNATSIATDLLNIIEVEGPISRSLLAKRIRERYELPKVSDKMEQQIEFILNKPRPKTTKSGTLLIYWPAGVDPATYDSYRKTRGDDPDRSLGEIAPEEVIACIKELAMVPLSERSLVRETTNALGYPRLNVDNENFIKSLLNVAVLNGDLEKNQQGLLKTRIQDGQ